MSQFSAEDLALLRSCDLLRKLSDKHFNIFISLSHKVSYNAGQVLLEEGQNSDYLSIILSGTVQLYKSNHHLIGSLSRGQSIGEMRVIKNRPCSLTVTTSLPTVVARISLSKLRGLEYYQCYEAILDAIINILTYRLINTNQLVVDEVNKKKQAPVFPLVAMVITGVLFVCELCVALYYFNFNNLF